MLPGLELSRSQSPLGDRQTCKRCQAFGRRGVQQIPVKQVKSRASYREMTGEWDGAVCQGPVQPCRTGTQQRSSCFTSCGATRLLGATMLLTGGPCIDWVPVLLQYRQRLLSWMTHAKQASIFNAVLAA